MSSKGEAFTKLLEEKELRDLSPYALRSPERRDKLKDRFRKGNTESLEYRTEYHRDRDRILWSKSFKRLQHKTQIFPHYVEDHYKRRLTHSLEVAQIATTIARALCLNEVATEAIALGHDLGHTPFGHAGEEALNQVLRLNTQLQDQQLRRAVRKLKNEAPKEMPVPVFGFDHCVHAIEVVSRIDKEYKIESDFRGLNLTFDVRDGILKHMSEREQNAKKPFSFIPEVVRFSEFQDFGNNRGSLEAQCVYFADKVAYLLGDIEDGGRSGILQCVKINKEPFFKKLQNKYEIFRKQPARLKKKADFVPLTLKEKADFVPFRSKALTTLILDCIDNATSLLNDKNPKDVEDVLSSDTRFISVSPDLEQAWYAFYKKWMSEHMFRNEVVMACNFKAKKIIFDLFKAYTQNYDLIRERYREHIREAYKRIRVTDTSLLKLITIRNYIAGMTDAFAITQHARLYMSREHIGLSVFSEPSESSTL